MPLFIPKVNTWTLQNLETKQLVVGDFPAESVNRSHGNKWAEHNALGRAKPILQFLHGQAETLSVRVRLFATSIAFNKVDKDLTLLESWMYNALSKQRPPICCFWVGSGSSMMDCVIEEIGGIEYGKPSITGQITDISLSLNLREYSKFDISANKIYETRYARTKRGEYYELLAEREYDDPMLGDVIRKRHPTKPVIQVSDVVKLPSVEAIRATVVEPTSIQLQTAFGKKLTPQKSLRQEMFDLRARPYVSHIIQQE